MKIHHFLPLVLLLYSGFHFLLHFLAWLRLQCHLLFPTQFHLLHLWGEEESCLQKLLILQPLFVLQHHLILETSCCYIHSHRHNLSWPSVLFLASQELFFLQLQLLVTVHPLHWPSCCYLAQQLHVLEDHQLHLGFSRVECVFSHWPCHLKPDPWEHLSYVSLPSLIHYQECFHLLPLEYQDLWCLGHLPPHPWFFPVLVQYHHQPLSHTDLACLPVLQWEMFPWLQFGASQQLTLLLHLELKHFLLDSLTKLLLKQLLQQTLQHP